MIRIILLARRAYLNVVNLGFVTILSPLVLYALPQEASTSVAGELTDAS
jgi:hypothetical protein